MNAYVADLNRALAREKAQHAEKQAATLQTVRERLTPLEDRLARLLSAIPEEVQREGLSLGHLQVSLRGRWRGSCHPGELGTALRKLGFQRERRWHGSGGFLALWFPPGAMLQSHCLK